MANKAELLNKVQRSPVYRWLAEQDYVSFLADMQRQTHALSIQQAQEEVWFCEHTPVYTTGKRGINNSKAQLQAPLIITDRGGETTFHGTGQLMMYPIINLKQYHLYARDYVSLLEESCILLLAQHGIIAERDCGLPGVWIKQQKIAALGIRISQGIASHGIALNINTDLHWFDHINPCGTSRKATTMHLQGAENLDIRFISRQWFSILKELLNARTA